MVHCTERLVGVFRQVEVRLIIDTDAGIDDAQAIMLALTAPGVIVEAITTVTGNVHVDKVVHNVFTVLDVMKAVVPVYRGAELPLLPGYWQPEVRVHGEDGLGDYRHHPPRRFAVEAGPAAAALVRLADSAPGALTLVGLGPMTNIALACKLDAGFARKIKRFVYMGGAFHGMGNTKNVSAEFNVFCDPEAALIVLDAFPHAEMISWETTLKHPFTWQEYDSLVEISTPAGRFLRDITCAHASQARQHSSRFLLPDPLAMAVALDPGLVTESREQFVTVEVHGSTTRGQTVIDHFNLTGSEPNVRIVTRLLQEEVYAMFRRMLTDGRG